MQISLIEIWTHMGLPARIVAGTLMILGVFSVMVFFERVFTLRRSRGASRSFSMDVAENMNAGKFDAVIEAADKFKGGHLARIVKAGLSTYKNAVAAEEVSGLTPLDQTQRFMERFMEEISADLRRGMWVLATVGSTAPFVGLLGTVLGIISAFQGIAATGSGGLASVSAGISEALIETAFGLFVAIPAVFAFNYLSTKIGHEELLLKNASGELLDTVEDWAERQAKAAPARGATARA
ncbi:MAG: MotA/TolQ/ExbB proton channel family protein [bacterium]